MSRSTGEIYTTTCGRKTHRYVREIIEQSAESQTLKEIGDAVDRRGHTPDLWHIVCSVTALVAAEIITELTIRGDLNCLEWRFGKR